jgi:hypothetical protein
VRIVFFSTNLLWVLSPHLTFSILNRNFYTPQVSNLWGTETLEIHCFYSLVPFLSNLGRSVCNYIFPQTCVEAQNTLIRWRSPNDRPVTLDSVAFSVKAFLFSISKYISSFRVAKISLSKHQTNPSWASACRICFPVYCSSWNPDNDIFRYTCSIMLHTST